MDVLGTIDRHLTGLRQALSEVSPTVLSGPDAAAVVERGVALERLGMATRTRFARRVEATGAYEQTGHRNAASWLAGIAGESIGAAQEVLETARRLEAAPVLDDAFRDGKLSLSQAKVTAEAGALDPSAQEELVRSAEQESFRETRERATRIKRHKEGEATLEAKERRAHDRRYLRLWSAVEGGVRLEGLLTTVDGARLKGVLERVAEEVFREARAAGVREPSDAYLADALVRAVTGEPGENIQPGAQVALRVDVAALRRGSVEGDEVCEIPGVGPIPVRLAGELLGDSLFHLLVTDGTDVQAITSQRRTIRTPLRRALNERDRRCSVPGCPNTRGLQIDHAWDYAKGGPTKLENLQYLCGPHHAMKSYRGFRLVSLDGKARWVGPGQRAGPPGPSPPMVDSADGGAMPG